MIKILIKKFISDYENVNDKTVRENYTVLSGIVGIICNFSLFLIKVIIGMVINSIAIVSDGFNNLSDMGTSLIGIIGAKLSNMRPDKEHPFGHGRMEYIASLIVSFIIILVGFELTKSSFSKILAPEKVLFSPVLMGILVLSVFVKLWMYFYNRYMAKKIDSSILSATSKDSLSDVFATGAIIISAFVGQFIDFPVDALMGLIVSVIIIYSGYSVAKDTITLLLGSGPDKETVDEISSIILSGEGILDIHDLIVHNYGPGRVMASVHAEVLEDTNVVKIHEIIDKLEQTILDKLGITIVIHIDPVLSNCEKTNTLKQMVNEIVVSIDKNLSIHDFKISEKDEIINMIFDIVVPGKYKEDEIENLKKTIQSAVFEKDEKYRVQIHIDNKY